MTNQDRVERVIIGVGFFDDTPLIGILEPKRAMWSAKRQMTEEEIRTAAYICIKYLAQRGVCGISAFGGVVTFDYKDRLKEDKI